MLKESGKVIMCILFEIYSLSSSKKCDNWLGYDEVPTMSLAVSFFVGT